MKYQMTEAIARTSDAHVIKLSSKYFVVAPAHLFRGVALRRAHKNACMFQLDAGRTTQLLNARWIRSTMAPPGAHIIRVHDLALSPGLHATVPRGPFRATSLTKGFLSRTATNVKHKTLSVPNALLFLRCPKWGVSLDEAAIGNQGG